MPSDEQRPAAPDVRLGGHAWAALALLVGVGTLARVWARAPGPEEMDGVFFVRALESYNVLAQRPHWPGYPVYVGLGRAALALVGDGVLAFQLVSCLATSVCAVPLALWIFEQGVGVGEARARRWALCSAALWSLAPITWLDGTEIFSDPPGLLLALGSLWLLSAPGPGGRERPLRLLVGMVLAGCVPGVRPSYLTLLGPALPALWRVGRGRGGLAVGMVAALALGWLSWAGWLAWHEGHRWWEAGRLHLTGHVQGWGGTVYTQPDLAGRVGQTAAVVWGWALGGWLPGAPGARLPLSLAWAAAGVLGVKMLLGQRAALPVGVGLAWWLVPYTVATFLGQDIALARYAFPWVVGVCVVVGAGLGAWGLAALALCGGLVLGPLVELHREGVSPERQAGGELLRQLPQARSVVFTQPRFNELRVWAPPLRTRPIRPGWEEEARRMAEDGYQVRVLTPDGSPPEGGGWRLTHLFCRDPWLRSRDAPVLALYALAGTHEGPPTAVECSPAVPPPPWPPEGLARPLRHRAPPAPLD